MLDWHYIWVGLHLSLFGGCCTGFQARMVCVVAKAAFAYGVITLVYVPRDNLGSGQLVLQDRRGRVAIFLGVDQPVVPNILLIKTWRLNILKKVFPWKIQ